MRLPNGYGSVIKLSGKRRKPFAVRITTGIKYSEASGRAVQTYKYLEYFEKRKDAMQYLAEFNAGKEVKEHIGIAEIPTFRECYERWIEEKEVSPKGLTASRERGLRAAFKRFEILHDRRITSIKHADVQPIVFENRHMSKASVAQMITVLKGIAGYAVKYGYITLDFSKYVEGTGYESKNIHKPFTREEIDALWKDQTDIVAAFALITIYTGMRPSELLSQKISNMDLENGYIIGGSKTEAGRNRVIPLHPRIRPLIKAMMKEDGRLFANQTLAGFQMHRWNPYMESHGMSHLPHDGRHTCATLMEAAGIPLHHRKLIMGHKIKDVTTGTYTHIDPQVLIDDISKL